jgi:hypothetical protein
MDLLWSLNTLLRNLNSCLSWQGLFLFILDHFLIRKFLLFYSWKRSFRYMFSLFDLKRIDQIMLGFRLRLNNKRRVLRATLSLMFCSNIFSIKSSIAKYAFKGSIYLNKSVKIFYFCLVWRL